MRAMQITKLCSLDSTADPLTPADVPIPVPGAMREMIARVLSETLDELLLAQSLGINVHWAKIKTYAIATAFVSVVGSFHACYIKNIEPEDTMSLPISILIALMAMLGGAGSLWGPIIGAGILIPLKSYLKEWLGAQAGLVGIDLIIYAIIIMLMPRRRPQQR